MRKKVPYIVAIFALILVNCTEPYQIEVIDFEGVLVVESTITNEVKNQVVKLSQSTTLDNPNIQYVSNASVTVTGTDGTSYSFSQDPETNDYISNEAFAAQSSVDYTLSINTADGREYRSSPVTMPNPVEIDSVYAERYNELGKDGVQVYVDAFDPTGESTFFRYEYEETYKIVVPTASEYTYEIINYQPDPLEYEIVVTPREVEDVCYSSENSTGIVQTSTTDLDENRVVHFPVNYLEKANSKMRERYSILVKQFVQSFEAYTFYEKINELGNVESLLSQGQPGYVTGNISALHDEEEKVVGYFEASPVTTKRTFFAYDDFNIAQPPYIYPFCDISTLDYRDNTVLDRDRNDREFLYLKLTQSNYQILQGVYPQYTITPPQCSYCTSFSSNVKPDFWDE